MIRQAEEADIKACAELEKKGFRLFWSEEDLKKDFEDNPFSLMLVDEEDGRIRAYALIWITFEQAQLVRIAVDPEFKRQGLGAGLIRAGLDAAREHGAEFFSLDVRVSNEPAIALYVKLGFIVLHRNKKYYEGKEDGLTMGIGI